VELSRGGGSNGERCFKEAGRLQPVGFVPNQCSFIAEFLVSITRRTFCRSIAGMTLVGFAASRLNAGEGPKKNFPPGRYVDVHTHIGTIPTDKTEPLTASDLLKWMDGNDIAQAWVLPLVSPESYPNPVSTEYVLTETKPYRDRLIPFCSIDPRNSFYGGKNLAGQIKRYVDAGAKGFGEHKVGLPVNDPKNLAVYEACQSVGIPILIHMDGVRNTDEPGLPGLKQVLSSFPKVNVVGHGPGTWASISGDATDLGGYPKGQIKPGGALDALLGEFPNYYLDLSAGSGANAMSRDPKFAREFLIRHKNRIMFGTDYLTIGQPIPQQEVLRSLDLPADAQQVIFRDNARRLVRLI
jgi:predicted TIM-barrel fold metal-dependent hydrolase